MKIGFARTVAVLCALAMAGPAPVWASEIEDAAPALSVGLKPGDTNQERSLLGVAGGVWVDEVSGANAQAGLLVGDVLLAINLKHIQTVDDVHRMVRGRPLQLALLIDRDGRRMLLPISLE